MGDLYEAHHLEILKMNYEGNNMNLIVTHGDEWRHHDQIDNVG
jgi:hypothetical protein